MIDFENSVFRFFILIILVLFIIIGTCALVSIFSPSPDESSQILVSDISEHNTNLNLRDVFGYTGPETGVCYLIYDGVNKGGITPRYNQDGSLMVKT